jgi:glycosyltransferase involved in cell wall biosynthesis
VSLQEQGVGNVSLLVADGKGDELVSDIKILDIGIPSRNRLGRAIMGSFGMWKKLRTLKHDIVHLHDPELLPLGLLINLTNNVVIYDMHENLPKEILTKNYINSIIKYPLSFILQIFQKIIFQYIPVVFAENSYTKDFKKVKKSAIVLNYPLIEKLNKVVIKKKNTFNIGYLGGISRERGALMQLRAIAELRAEGFEIETTFIGPCSDEVVNSDIYKLGISERWAFFSGRVKPEDAWLRISECHVGLVILEPSPNFVESYPTKLFEYMILGLPCIVSDFPLYRRVVEEAKCGLLVNPLVLSDLKESIKWMYENQLEAIEMGMRGRYCATEKYNWSSEFLKLKKLYIDLISKEVKLI